MYVRCSLSVCIVLSCKDFDNVECDNSKYVIENNVICK